MSEFALMVRQKIDPSPIPAGPEARWSPPSVATGTAKPARSFLQKIRRDGIPVVALLLSVGCAPLTRYADTSRFTIATSAGMIDANITSDGVGESRSRLAALVRRGVAQAYTVGCDAGAERHSPADIMLWHMSREGPKPMVMITVRLLRSGRVLRRASASVPAPETEPNDVFIEDISLLGRRVLPPPAMLEPTFSQACPHFASL
jgi:hypothetical protein